jgi:hypothetical protein
MFDAIAQSIEEGTINEVDDDHLSNIPESLYSSDTEKKGAIPDV